MNSASHPNTWAAELALKYAYATILIEKKNIPLSNETYIQDWKRTKKSMTHQRGGWEKEPIVVILRGDEVG